jgi:hypothetical protein
MATNGTRQGEGGGDVDAGLVYSNAAGLGSLSRNQEKALSLSLPARFELKSWPLSPSRCSVLPLLCPVWCKLVYCVLILSRNSTCTAAWVPDQRERFFSGRTASMVAKLVMRCRQEQLPDNCWLLFSRLFSERQRGSTHMTLLAHWQNLGSPNVAAVPVRAATYICPPTMPGNCWLAKLRWLVIFRSLFRLNPLYLLPWPK